MKNTRQSNWAGWSMISNIDVHETVCALEEAAADFIVSRVHASIQNRGKSLIALSGGDTPRGVYRRLSTAPCKNQIDWTRIHICFVDERLVPPEDPQSNFGMVKTELLSRISIPKENVHRIHGEFSAEDAAKDYAGELKCLLDGKTDRFDLVLLGVGEDGHTASLFPGTDVLDERNETVRAVYVPWLKSWRVTMTYPVLNNARDVLFLVAGKQKATIVQRVLSARQSLRDVPATVVRPSNGGLLWMLDKGAAASLGTETISPVP